MSMRLRFKAPWWVGIVLGLFSGLGLARVGSAALFLQQTAVPLPQGDLVQYTISAIGSEGEFINVFASPSITPATESDLGVHNVWSPHLGLPHMPEVAQERFMSARPTDPEWMAYDTHFLFDSSQLLELGLPWTESNDGSTSGTLGLPPAFGSDPMSGFGDFSSHEWSCKAVLRDFGGSSLPFMQVVMRAGDLAHLNIELVALTNPTTAFAQQFTNYVIGLPDPPLPDPPPSRVFEPDFQVITPELEPIEPQPDPVAPTPPPVVSTPVVPVAPEPIALPPTPDPTPPISEPILLSPGETEPPSTISEPEVIEPEVPQPGVPETEVRPIEVVDPPIYIQPILPIEDGYVGDPILFPIRFPIHGGIIDIDTVFPIESGELVLIDADITDWSDTLYFTQMITALMFGAGTNAVWDLAHFREVASADNQAAAPEPATVLLASLALAGLTALFRRR